MNDKEMPLVSVVMSVYNEPLNWIKQSIDSILNQTFTDFEFIIINDMPERNELSDFLKVESIKDKRIKIHKNDKNEGLARSLNKGVNLSIGHYIARMDADDISLPYRLEKQIEFLNSHKDIGICGTRAKKINEKGEILSRIKMPLNDKTLKERICFFCPFIHPSTLIKKDLLAKNCFDDKCRTGQDWDLWIRLAKITHFANLKEELLLYRIHESKAPQKAGIERTKASREYAARKIIDDIKLDEQYIPLYLRFATRKTLTSIELDNLFIGLLKNPNLSKSHSAIIARYLREKKKYGIFGIVSNPLIFKFPLQYIQSIIIETSRVFL